MSNEVSPAPAVGAVVAAEWNRDVLSVTGPDSISFLQGQLSADVEALEVGSSTLSLLLDPGGKMVAVLRLWRTDERIVFIDTDAGSGAQVQDRLSRFLLRTDAEITAHGWQCVAVRGESSASVDVSQTSAVLVGPCVWPGTEGLDLLGPSVSPPASAEPAPEGLLEALRIRSGWPTAAAEVTDDVIPAEIGSWLIGAAVSFTKGCYVGQELTARIDSRGGNTPRNLRRALPGGMSASSDSRVASRRSRYSSTKCLICSRHGCVSR